MLLTYEREGGGEEFNNKSIEHLIKCTIDKTPTPNQSIIQHKPIFKDKPPHQTN